MGHSSFVFFSLLLHDAVLVPLALLCGLTRRTDEGPHEYKKLLKDGARGRGRCSAKLRNDRQHSSRPTVICTHRQHKLKRSMYSPSSQKSLFVAVAYCFAFLALLTNLARYLHHSSRTQPVRKRLAA